MSSISSDSLALRDHPFKITPDGRFFYRGRVMQAVYDSLLEGVFERQGLLLVAGEAGTGKTTLLFKLKEALEATDCLVVFPRSPVLSFDELINACCQAAGVGAAATSRLNRIRAFTDVLVRQVDQGRATAVLIDDAEELNDEFLADLSRLTAIEKGGRRLVQIVLAGHHELVQRLSASELPFVQECAIGYRRLAGLDRHEVAEYVAYRLARVGREGVGFAPPAIRRIAQISKGVPQVINQLCGMCLHIAELEGSESVSLEIVEATAPDFLTDSESSISAVPAAAPSEAKPAAPEETPHVDPKADTAAEPQPGPLPIDWRSFRGEMRNRVADPQAAETLPPLPSFYRNEVRSEAAAPGRRALLIALMFVIGSALGGAGAYYLGAWPGQEPGSLAEGATPLGLPDVASDRTAEGSAVGALPPSDPQVAGTTDPSPRLDQAVVPTADPQLRPTAPKPALSAAAVPPASPAPAATPPTDTAPSRLAAPTPKAEAPAAPAKAVAKSAPASQPEPTIALPAIEPKAAAPAVAASSPVPATPPKVAAEVPAVAQEPGEDSDSQTLLPRQAPKALLAAREAAAPSTPDPEPRSAAKSRPLTIAPTKAPERPAATLQAGQSASPERPLVLAPAPGDAVSQEPSPAPSGTALAAGSAAPSAGIAQAPLSLRPIELRPPEIRPTARADLPAATAPEAARQPAAPATATADTLTTAALSREGLPAVSTRPSKGVIIQFAALRSEIDAGRERERLHQRFGGLLKPLDLSIVKADVNGVSYYRVRSAPLDGRGKAYDLCAELRKSAQGCMVIHPDGFVAGGADDKLAVAFDAVKTQAPDAAPAVASANELDLIDLVVARDVQDREPVDPTEVFTAAAEQAYVHAKVRNSGPRAKVAFVWRYDDALISRFETEIGTSVRWRTWSSSALQPGAWKVQLVAADGQILGQRAFIVE